MLAVYFTAGAMRNNIIAVAIYVLVFCIALYEMRSVFCPWLEKLFMLFGMSYIVCMLSMIIFARQLHAGIGQAINNSDKSVTVASQGKYDWDFEEAKKFISAGGDKQLLGTDARYKVNKKSYAPLIVHDVLNGEDEWNEIKSVHTNRLILLVYIEHLSVSKGEVR